MNANAPLSGLNRVALTTVSGTKTFTITEAMFSSDAATCQNRLRAEVLSQLVVADQQDATVQAPVSIGGNPPSVTSVTLNKKEYFEGDTATVTWTVSGSVAKVHVTAVINGFVVYDQDIVGGAGSVSFAVPRAGTLQVEVTALSNTCQPSEVFRSYATVGDAYPGLCEVYPSLPQCTTAAGIDLILFVAGVVVVLLISFLVALLVPPKAVFRLLAFLLSLSVGTILLISAVGIPDVSSFGGLVPFIPWRY
jgi:hypothetical protein